MSVSVIDALTHDGETLGFMRENALYVACNAT